MFFGYRGKVVFGNHPQADSSKPGEADGCHDGGRRAPRRMHLCLAIHSSDAENVNRDNRCVKDHPSCSRSRVG